MGRPVNAKGTWKRVINEEGHILMEGNILDDSNLYVVNPAYFMTNEDALHVEMAIAKDSSQVKIQFAVTAGLAVLTDEKLLARQNMELWDKMHAISVMQCMILSNRCEE